MQLNFIAPESVSPLFAGDTIFPNHPCFVGTRNLMAPKILCGTNPTGPILHIQMHIHKRNLSGFRTYTAEILTYLSVNYMANSVLKRATPDIQALYIVFIVDLVTPAMPLLRKK